MALAGQAFALRLAAQNSFMRSDWASRASLDMPLRCRRGFVWGTADATVDFGGRPRCLGFDSASHFGGRPGRLGAPAARRENIRIASSTRSRSSWSSARVLLRSMFTEGPCTTPPERRNTMVTLALSVLLVIVATALARRDDDRG